MDRIDPINLDDTPEPPLYPKCGCGHENCELDPADASNQCIRGVWFNADCCGLCYPCGQVDDLKNLIRLGGSYLAHEGCAGAVPVVAEGREREARVDERNAK